MNLIGLSGLSGEPVWINVSQICWLTIGDQTPAHTGSRIGMSSGNTVDVLDTLEAVIQLIVEALPETQILY